MYVLHFEPLLLSYTYTIVSGNPFCNTFVYAVRVKVPSL